MIPAVSGQVVIRQDGDGAVRFNVLDQDGTVLASSKGFASATEARAGFDRMRVSLGDADVVDQTGDDNPVRSSPEIT